MRIKNVFATVMLISGLSLAGCGDEEPTPVGSGSTAGTGSGSGSGKCDKYISCLEAVAGQSGLGAQYQQALNQAKQQYGSGGACGQSSTTQAQCDQACDQAQSALKTAFANLSACK